MSIDQVLRNELTPQQYDAAVDTARVSRMLPYA